MLMVSSDFLLYGATGYVGREAARLALQQGLRPMLAGRDAAGVRREAEELGVDFRVFSLDEPAMLDQALRETGLILHCAGPYIHTSSPVADACLRTGAHYLDLTGEIPVYAELASRDAEARRRGVMLLPGVGFDVVPTDCLAVRLKQRLPTANQLNLAFVSKGPGGLPPGTQRTAIEMAQHGIQVRLNGKVQEAGGLIKTRMVNFGSGPVLVTRMTWGDVFTAYHSTGIPNIEVYLSLPAPVRLGFALLPVLRPLLRQAAVRDLLKRLVRPGPGAEQRAQTVTHVWGEVRDEQGRSAAGRVHGPEAGVIWTIRAALAAVRRVLSGSAAPGFQTPAMAFGPDFVLEAEGVTIEDLE
jgi:short subunit dehydrogenase-like uncharacterized protein